MAGGGNRQHLERDIGQYAQRALGAGHHAGEIVARHVLHDFAAKAQQFAFLSDHPRAQHEIPGSPGPGATGAGHASGDRTANGAGFAKDRWLERQHLMLLGKCCVQRVKPSAGPHGHHQLHGVVGDDAAMGRDIELRAFYRAAIESPGVSRHDA